MTAYLEGMSEDRGERKEAEAGTEAEEGARRQDNQFDHLLPLAGKGAAAAAEAGSGRHS